jgi:hypothetical protein
MLRPPASRAAAAAAAAPSVVLALLVGFASQSAAQQGLPPSPAAARDSAALRLPKQAVSFQRSSMMFDRGGSVEFERAVSRRFSLALALTGWRGTEVGGPPDGSPSSLTQRVDFTTREGTLRFYPGGQPLNGFSLALTGGHAVAAGELWDQPRGSGSSLQTTGGRVRGPLVATEAGYSWLLGDRHNLLVNTGIGMRHVFLPTTDNARRTYLTYRFGLGFAF